MAQNENGAQAQHPPRIATMLAKSGRLFEDGYWAQMLDAETVTVQSPPTAPGRFAPRYNVNVRLNTCQCEAFLGGRYRMRDGRRTCKHLNGVFLLAACCADSMDVTYNMVAAEFNEVADAYERSLIHGGATLQYVFGKSARAETADNSRKLAAALNEMLERYRPRDDRYACERRAAA